MLSVLLLLALHKVLEKTRVPLELINDGKNSSAISTKTVALNFSLDSSDQKQLVI